MDKEEQQPQIANNTQPQPNQQQQQQQNNENKVEATKELVFKQYPSIEPSVRTKTIKVIREEGYANQNIMWVASEKIHGSNFSVHCSGDKVRYGRRTDFLSDEIDMDSDDPGKYFKQSFYDARNLVKTFHNKLPNISKTLKQLYPDMLKFSIYGQYFGGNFPNSDGKYKQVQKGVYYIPHHEFMVFDIRIFTDKTTFWVDVTDIPKCLGDNLKAVPIYARGTFQEMFAIDTKIDSTIPELFGFGKVENNIIQGFVLRPNTSMKFKNNERVILKKKNKEFQQKASAPNPAKKQQKQKVVDPEVAAFADALSAYLNFNRIESVVSKFPDLKDRNKLKQEIIKDVMGDAVKDQYKEPEGDLAKKVKVEFDKRVIKALNQYFEKN